MRISAAPTLQITGLVFVMLTAATCGKKDSGSTTTSPAPSDIGATISITATGVSNAAPRINVGQRVRFTNNDSQPHEILSTPHVLHSDCMETNTVSTLQPGQSRETSVYNQRDGCGWHDHRNPDDARFRGQIIIGFAADEPPPPDPEY